MKHVPSFALLGALAMLVFISGPHPGALAGTKVVKASRLSEIEKISWFEGSVRKWAFRADDEIAVMALPGKQKQVDPQALADSLPAGAALYRRYAGITLFRLQTGMAWARLQTYVRALKNSRAIHSISPVFYAGADKNEATRMILTGELIVRWPTGMPPDQMAQAEASHGLERLKQLPYAPNTFLFGAPEAMASLEIAQMLHDDGQVIYAYPTGCARAQPNSCPMIPCLWISGTWKIPDRAGAQPVRM